MATLTLLVLQPHLRERLEAVKSLLDSTLRKEVEAVLEQPSQQEVEVGSRASADTDGTVTDRPGGDVPEKNEKHDGDPHAGVTEAVGAEKAEVSEKAEALEKEEGVADPEETKDEEPEVVPPTVDAELLERLSRWATGNEKALRSAGLDAGDYSYIALMAGTSAYLPRTQARALREAEKNSEKPSPYLPAHLSPTLQPTFASEYRQLTRLLSTLLNILFSVVGCGFAAYVAATTGAGWSRENAVLLAVAVGVIVGIADTGIVFLYKRRVKEDGERSARLRAKYSRGTGGVGVLLERDTEGEITKEIALGEDEGVVIPAPKREIRLRRRAVKESS